MKKKEPSYTVVGMQVGATNTILQINYVLVLISQLCPAICDPMDCSLPGSSIHGILQARILEWIVISFSRGSSWPRDRIQVSVIAGRFFTIWATREAHNQLYFNLKNGINC